MSRNRAVTKRIVVVVDDRESEDLEAISAKVLSIAMVLWSRRSELVTFLIEDATD
jgi:hypothetical protein